VGVAGFILPGDRVDVMITREVGKDTKITDVVLQNVKVIGIDQNSDEDASGAKVVKAVTLEVSPDQAQQLTLSASVGELSLSLRNYLDVNSAPVRTVTVADLRYGGPATPSTKPYVRRTFSGDRSASILITRGTDSSVYRIR
jgi:pilus assembly protein CpaB